MKNKPSRKLARFGLCLYFLCMAPGLLSASEESRLSDIAPPFKDDDELPSITSPIIEIGDAFLNTGNISPGFTLPTGAVWQPRFWVYGQYNTAVQAWDTGNGDLQGEWANRLDVFGNLQLTGTERVVIGLQPLQGQNGRQTGYQFAQRDNGFEEFNADVRTLFFEGDFAELFPNLDYKDFTPNDLGFSIGRQELVFQNGFLVNDIMDAVGITRNNLRFTGLPWLAKARISAVYAWNSINRANGSVNGFKDRNANMFALFSQFDTDFSTYDVDFAYVTTNDQSGGDLAVLGIDSIQRFGSIATTFRVLGSWAPNVTTLEADNGVLFFTEVAWTPPHGEDLVYFDAFAGINNFRSVARGPLSGGPLGQTGILFAARGVGSFPPALSNNADQAYGAAIGYQMFFDNSRRQVIVEMGGRSDNANNFSGAGLAARFQQALGRRYIVQFDGFGAVRDNGDLGYGVRSEFIVKF